MEILLFGGFSQLSRHLFLFPLCSFVFLHFYDMQVKAHKDGSSLSYMYHNVLLNIQVCIHLKSYHY